MLENLEKESNQNQKKPQNKIKENRNTSYVTKAQKVVT